MNKGIKIALDAFVRRTRIAGILTVRKNGYKFLANGSIYNGSLQIKHIFKEYEGSYRAPPPYPSFIK